MSAVLGREVKKQNTGTRNQYYHAGGAAPMARDFVKSLYASTFERNDPQFAVDAYTTSFSTHAADTPYELENGLESQWKKARRCRRISRAGCRGGDDPEQVGTSPLLPLKLVAK
jgi:hypothetical protein